MDAKSPSGTDVYQTLNLVVRRHGKENNFKAVLETVRGLMAGTGSINRVIPPWLQPVLLGQGDPNAASYKSSTLQEYSRKTVGVANPDAALDYGDTFLNEEHVRASFPDAKVIVDGREEVAKEEKNDGKHRLNYRVRAIETDGKPTVEATSYPFLEHVKGNPVRFTPIQVGAIRSGLSSGLTVVVGPPGTGKTDVAVQIIASLYHSFPTQRTVVITHSNAALNDIFQKVMSRGDVEERYLLRLGGGNATNKFNPRFHKAGSRSLVSPNAASFCRSNCYQSRWASVVRLNEELMVLRPILVRRRSISTSTIRKRGSGL
jgi:intron-binding protein aquarius